MAEGKRKLAAILSADVAGYSRLMGADEEATVAALNDCRAIFKSAIAEHEGHVVDTAGDSVLAEFASVVEAVRAAVAVQESLAERNKPLSQDKRMHFRIGVNLGDVIVHDDGTIYGDGVNVAARLESLAEPGGITVSEDAYRQVEGKTDLRFEDLGEHEVKNIARPVRAYRITTEIAIPTVTELPLALPDKPSIAVLPFDNLSGDPEQEYFADGIAEDIITSLSRDHGLFVIARNSSFTYKGQAVNVTQVGNELGVRYVIEGSVRKAGNRVRITAQLVDAITGSHVWAERYDRELEDIFAVQDEITEKVVTSVAPELMSAAMDRARRKPPDNLDAWDYALRSMWRLQRQTREDTAEGLRLAEKATRLDPDDALCFTALASCHLLSAGYSWSESYDDSMTKAFEAAKHAVTLDSGDAVAHQTLGQANLYADHHREAVHRFERAIELNPNYALAHAFLGWTLACMGESECAIAACQRALRLSPRDPMSASWCSMAGFAAFGARRYEEGIDWARQGLEENSEQPGCYRVLAASAGQAGRLDEARAAIAQLDRVAPDITIKTTRTQIPWQDPANMERYLDGLRKAGLREA